MWDTTITLQPKIFLYSILFGIMISVFYDLFKTVRRLRKFSDVGVFFQDIAFFLIVTPSVFIFLLAFTYGVLRGFVLTGLISGFFIWRITFSKYFVSLLALSIGFVIRIIIYLLNKISHFIDTSIIFIDKKMKKLFKKVKKAFFSLKKS